MKEFAGSIIDTINLSSQTLTLIYILVVGQFGLATGSGGITQSYVRTTSRIYQINHVYAFLLYAVGCFMSLFWFCLICLCMSLPLEPLHEP